jgi:hypothetical protein
MTLQIFEGTWEEVREEIRSLDSELSGQLVRIQVERQETTAEAVPAKSMADLFTGRTGRIHSGGRERLSERVNEEFAEYLERKRREGAL